MDVGILSDPIGSIDIRREEVVERGGKGLAEILSTGNKGAWILNMKQGIEAVCQSLANKGLFQGVIGIGGAQGTAIICAGMRQFPTRMPKLPN